MQNLNTALVAVSGTAYSFDALFSYIVPNELAYKVRKGIRVLVPFGRSNTLREGMVFGFENKTIEECDGLKKISQCLDETAVLNDEMLDMALYLSETTFCTYYDAVKAVLPPAMRYKKRDVYSLDLSNVELGELNNDEVLYIESLAGCKNVSKRIEADFSDNRNVINSLIAKDIILKCSDFSQKGSEAFIKTAIATSEYTDNPQKFRLTQKQKTAMTFILENQGASIKEICENCGVTSVVVNNLEKCGAISLCDDQLLRIPKNITKKKSVKDIVLSDHQYGVYSQVASYIRNDMNTAKAFLLHGVTGSGKTAVFAKLIEKTVMSGKTAMYLVPEISLTPQMSQYFVSLFGERVALIHSALSLGRRLDEYNRIKRGDADIVIGTRSAVFAPLDNIGLIIIDEEGERTYKSESSPRYNTISVAKKRCRTHSSVLLLASATPTIESFYLAQKGVYQLLTLSERYHNNPLPETEIIDMSTQELYGRYMSFSAELKNAVEDNLNNGQQTILLLNRRGYHTIITCRDCHKAIFCPNCSVPMTYHKSGNKLMCHYCGHNEEYKNECPECHGIHLKPGGFGTQKLEEEVAELFPNARILRMDADTSTNVLAYEKSYNEFLNGEYDILLGTQMIGKGLDFPNVTLVGVLSVDKSLFTGDFKSYEHTFSLITQVIGRSGRGEQAGRAVLQTYIPDHYVLNLAASQDYKEFYMQEIAARKVFLYPPICDLCVIGFSGKDNIAVESAAKHFVYVMKQYISENKPNIALRVLGPSRCGFERIDEHYRYRLILKCKNNSDFRLFLRSVIKQAGTSKLYKGVSMYADLNGEVGY